jgi:hypothetical protein
MPSRILKADKSTFYAAAQALGAPINSGDDLSRFPLFVKPAARCASMFVDEQSNCKDAEELQTALSRLEQILKTERHRRPDPITFETKDGIVIPSDVNVSQYIPGRDYSVVVVEVGDHPQPLCP